MTEDQYYPSYLDEQLSNTTVNTGCDFNKYDPYVEKIRTLFVPSLEPRIYSCLETFVYREDQKVLPEPPYLKRCLDVPGTWREPVYAISTKLGDRRFLEKMLTQAVTYLIKDGLIDCFLNSIILNNRLNKVCRHLDDVGVEKNFLRYLAVWNYINERDYWIENDNTTSMSILSPSYDSIESHSDLDVQVGSELDTERSKRHYEQASKRLAVDSSESFCNIVNDFPENYGSPQFWSQLNIDSTNPEESESSGIRKKPRSITQQRYPCRPWNCPRHRTKSSQQRDWEGKTLKLRVCKIRRTNFDCGMTHPCRLSKFSLPCKSDDIIAEIMKADSSIIRLQSITTRRKLQTGVTKICHCINETLSTMSTEEVKRCRFHCEILPGFVTFKLLQRELNGCKICLFSDLIVTEKINGQFTPRTSPFSQKFDNIEEENVDKSPISETTRADLANKDLHLVSNLPAETKSETERQVANSIRLPESDLDTTNHQKPNEFVGKESVHELSENDVNDQTCGCSSSIFNAIENSDHKEEVNTGINRAEGSETTADRNNSVESPEKAALVLSSGNAIEDGSCYCNDSGKNKLEIFNHGPEKPLDTDCVDSFEETKTRNLGKEMPPENSLNRLSGKEVEDQTRLCSNSFPNTFYIDRDSEKNQERDCAESLETNVKEMLNCQESCQDACNIIPDFQKISCVDTEKTGSVVDTIENDQQAVTSQLRFSNSSREVKSRNGMTKEIQRDGIRGCECPASCECINKRSDKHEVAECDSCGAPEKWTSLNPVSEITRISPLVNPEQPSMVDLLVPNRERSILTEKSQYFDNASSAQLQSNFIESQTNSGDSHHPKTFDTANIQLQPNCVTSQANSRDLHHPKNVDTVNIQLQPNCVRSEVKNRDSHHPKNYLDTSTKSKISFPSSVSKTPLLGTEIEETCRTHTSFKSIQTLTEKLPSSVMKETTKRLSLAKSPFRIDTGRASSSKSQRINISIELCSESESVDDKSIKNEPSIILPVRPNGLIRSCVQDLPSMWKPRCHPADAGISRKQAILRSEKNTKDECLRHLRGINACLHSPPQPLESRDYLPPQEQPPRIRNPIVYGMSTKSERQSIRQRERRKNGLKYSKSNKNSRCCNKVQENEQIEKPDEFPTQYSLAATRPKSVSSSVIHNNLCHAFSASSVDRMKHLIKTKLRRILLERDKATNTPKTSLTNEKYRVSVPNGKTKRLPFSRQRCRTIWESRSASVSTRTSKTFGSNGRSLAEVSPGDDIKTLFNSTTNSKIVSLDNKDLKECYDCDKTTCYYYRKSDQSVVSSRIDQRLVGGSDAPCRKEIDREFRCLWKQREESVRKITNREVEYVYNNCDDRFSSKSINRSCTSASVAGDASAKFLPLCNAADCNEEATFNEQQDAITKCPGKLDCSGNSTSRHIYLYEYGHFESSNDGEDNSQKWCKSKIWSPKSNSLPICKQGQTQKNSKKTQRAHKKNCRQVISRASKRFNGESNIHRNIRPSSFVSSKIQTSSSIKCQQGFGKLDQDLRSKLLQYVSLCKSVKYSLLKMLRPDDVYDVKSLSISRANRYKSGDS